MSLPPAAWGPARVLQGAGVFILALIGVGVLVAILSEATGLDSGGTASTAIAQALFEVAFVAIAFACATAPGERTSRPAALGLRRFGGAAIRRMGAAYGAYWVFAVAYAVLLVRPEQQDIARDLGADQGTLATIAAGALIVGAAPFAEEIFFRGFMFAGLRRRLPLWPAAAISAAVFGLVHAPTGPAAVPPLVVLGLILAWLYEKTGSLWPPILVHLTNNAIAFAVLTG